MKKSFKKTLSILLSALLICSMAFGLQIKPVIAEEAGSTDEVSFYENLSEAEFAEDDTITVLIEFDYPENDYDVRDTDSLESSQEQLRLLRASNRAYYTENNQEFIDDLDIEYDDMEISAYSPYVFVTFETWAEYIDAREDLIELSEDDKVNRVFAEETPVADEESVNVNNSTSTEEMSMDDAKKMIGVKNENGSNVTNYTGAGIRVGIIESSYPINSENIESEHIKGIRSPIEEDLISIFADSINHAEKVCSIIGGTHGIAPDVDFYFARCNPFVTAVEWLVDQQVNIVNVSWGTQCIGSYTYYDVYTDYISRTNLILFIAGAGNYNEAASVYRAINSPGLGLNVLTVGSVDANKNISDFSNYIVEDAFSKKPTFVAPGENIIIPDCDNSEINRSGTSFSAPMVTGIAALLMEEFSSLIIYPELFASALINGCDWLPEQQSMWELYAGSGMVNYEKTRNILLEQRYDTATVVETEPDTIVLLEASIFLGFNEELTFCLFDLARQALSSDMITNLEEGDTAHLIIDVNPEITKYHVKILNSSGNYVFGRTSANNILLGKFINTYASGTYYIQVCMINEKKFASSEYLALTYSTTHEHSYTSYTKFNKHMHMCHCACGESITELHVFQEIFGEARTCSKCGYSE